MIHPTPEMIEAAARAICNTRNRATPDNSLWNIVDAITDEIGHLRAALAKAQKAIEAIKNATLQGRVCDDTAWFDEITTLHDFCDLVLAEIQHLPAPPPPTGE